MKYIGSKAKIANEIVPILQSYISAYNIKQYVEPFAGGFNVIDKIQCEYRLGNDIDPLVCELVEAFRENPALLDELNTPSRAEYYDVRDNPDKYPCWYRAAVLLFGSYNARVYGGCYGATAVTKDGKTRNYFNEARENFRRQLPALRNILVGCCDYRELRLPERERACLLRPALFGRYRLRRRQIRYGAILGMVQDANGGGAYRNRKRIRRTRRLCLYLATRNNDALKQPQQAKSH